MYTERDWSAQERALFSWLYCHIALRASPLSYKTGRFMETNLRTSSPQNRHDLKRKCITALHAVMTHGHFGIGVMDAKSAIALHHANPIPPPGSFETIERTVLSNPKLKDYLVPMDRGVCQFLK